MLFKINSLFIKKYNKKSRAVNYKDPVSLKIFRLVFVSNVCSLTGKVAIYDELKL